MNAETYSPRYGTSFEYIYNEESPQRYDNTPLVCSIAAATGALSCTNFGGIDHVFAIGDPYVGLGAGVPTGRQGIDLNIVCPPSMLYG